MREQLVRRLQELKAEFERGQKELGELEAQMTNLRNTLLRISGAIQVLDEELAKYNGDKIKPDVKQGSRKNEKVEMAENT